MRTPVSSTRSSTSAPASTSRATTPPHPPPAPRAHEPRDAAPAAGGEADRDGPEVDDHLQQPLGVAVDDEVAADPLALEPDARVVRPGAQLLQAAPAHGVEVHRLARAR